MRRAQGARLLAVALIGSSLAMSSAVAAADPEVVTGHASVSGSFASANDSSATLQPAAGGRFVAFASKATNLVSGTTAGSSRVYLRDLWTDATTLVSRTSTGTPNSSPAYLGAVSPDGAWVVFATEQAMIPGDTNGAGDVYLWRRSTGAIELVSRTNAGGLGNGHSGTALGAYKADVSDDGRYVFFSSAATNMTPVADLNGKVDVFRRDRTTGSTILVSANGAAQGTGDSYEPDASGNGRYVAFTTLANNFPGTDTNGVTDIWFRDLADATLQKVSVGSSTNPNGASSLPTISDDGDRIVFETSASNLIANDTNNSPDVYFRQRSTNFTNRLSTASGSFAQLPSGGYGPTMSPDGVRIGFLTSSPASGADTNGTIDLYVRESGTTRLVSLRSSGAQQTQPVIMGSVTSTGLVAWSTEDRATATDPDSTSDVFFRHQPFLGPFATIDAFVPFQVQRFTGVAPSSTQTLATRNRLRAGGSPYTFIMGLADAPSFSDRRAPVIRLYWAYFKRRPDLGGLNFWLNRYRNGARLVDISNEFAKSSEFRNKYGNTTPEQFVTLVYQNVLERNPDAGGLSFWANRIRSGTPRGQVMTNFSESSEGRRVIGPRSDTILVALGMYGKIPSASLFNTIVADRQAGLPREIIPISILGAPEYAATL
jgi:Tol biopolymer transport system component